ncbi:uncharacterized protein MYCFIDRAFT_200698 [Pseudocercospora fijiensis CIRAD86]|uniref:F-box domain-containing protein n=1 Tax=Pseudocercospora fijiensis (strain CIRAD86) TaxID=383855 RepID=M2ZZ51_PSEFD|nr:uncharacterized protein MYCFIDRAFT_200698 [Pseudocercospora fijiensis CIRAD86]EME77431.1 hypothetical protein MYCFIDRAFT_200698 [Pseudocercospora fijiensis CIRAD86]
MAPAPGHDYFTELPLEMLQHIASYLGAWDELKLRTVFPKTKQQIMVGTLGELISTVYVSPTKTSLEHFCKIAAPSFFAEHIRKLVYIPRALDETIDDLLSVVEARKTCDEFNHIVSEHKTDHSAWSSTIDDFVLKFLRKGLARLQGLKVVVLANNIQDDGLNATALWYCNELCPKPIVCCLQGDHTGEAHLRNMELGNCLCGQLKFGQEYHGLTRCMDAALDALTYVVPKLRKLTISCSDEWSASMKTEAFWKYIASRSNGIQDLTLLQYINLAGVIVSERSDPNVEGGRSPEHFTHRDADQEFDCAGTSDSILDSRRLGERMAEPAIACVAVSSSLLENGSGDGKEKDEMERKRKVKTEISTDQADEKSIYSCMQKGRDCRANYAL